MAGIDQIIFEINLANSIDMQLGMPKFWITGLVVKGGDT